MRRAQPWRTNRSRVLRANSTFAEDALWQQIRGRRLGGFKFARQCPIGTYFADFICRDRKLVVEIDGATHASDDELRNDAKRENFLVEQGYRIFSVRNHEIFENINGVLDGLLAELEKQQ